MSLVGKLFYKSRTYISRADNDYLQALFVFFRTHDFSFRGFRTMKNTRIK